MMADTERLREAVFRFRYQVYVQEMNLFETAADHDHGRLVDAEDETARIFVALLGDEVVGTLRLNWGGDAPFAERKRCDYDLDRFLNEVAPAQITVSSRFVVRDDLRGDLLSFQLIMAAATFGQEHGVEVAVCDCQPHLINLYRRLGFRSYTETINDPQFGILVPLVLIWQDVQHLERVGSPFLSMVQRAPVDPQFRARLVALVPSTSTVRSADEANLHEYWEEISLLLNSRVGRQRQNFFEGLTEDRIEALLAKSHIIACSRGDHVIQKGQVTRTMFIVLEGTLEVRIDGRTVGVITEGDIFGEVAFLLSSRRMADVLAASDSVRVLALSERQVWRLIEHDPDTAAKLLLNLSKALCIKLMNTRY